MTLLFRGFYAVLAQIAICRKIRVFCAIFWLKICVCAIFYAFSISDLGAFQQRYLVKSQFFKNGSEEIFYVAASTASLGQFLAEVRFFHKYLGGGMLWKNPKNDIRLAKFSCGNGRRFAYFFFRISDFIFQKIAKITKKIFESQKNQKTTPWYIYFDLCFV